jgi:RNA polymerase primary sigma factor
MVEENSLKVYLKEINNHPLLSGEEEKSYAIKAKDGDEYSKKKLIESNLRLVVSVAKKYRGKGLDFLDLISEGNIGLMNSIDRFDPAKEVRLIHYATWGINQSIRRAIYNTSRNIRIPVNKAKKAPYFKEKINTFGKRDGLENLSKNLGINKKEFFSLFDSLDDTVSLEARVYKEDDSPTIGESFEENKYESFEENLFKECLIENINNILRSFENIEKEVIEYRFGLNGKPELTLKAIGEKFSLSKERIRQLEKKVLKELRGNDSVKEELNSYLN